MKKFFIQSWQQLRKNDGYTLIEIIVTLSIGSIVMLLLVSSFQFAIIFGGKLSSEHLASRDARGIYLFFERQILKSEKIYIKGEKLYLQDVETPAYYNTYFVNTNTHMLYRAKYYENNLRPLPLGGTAQFASAVSSMVLEIDKKNVVYLEIVVDDQRVNLVHHYDGEVIRV